MFWDRCKHYLRYDYSDWHRAMLGAFAALSAIIVCELLHLGLAASMWMVVYTALTAIAIRGHTKCQQLLTLLYTTILTICSLLIVTYTKSAWNVLGFWIFMIALFWALQVIPTKLPQLSVAILIILVYLILQISQPVTGPFNLWQQLHDQSLAIIIAMIILGFWIVVLPGVKIAVVEIDNSHYYYKRIFRLSIAIPISFLVADLLHLQHASWICYSAIVVSQVNVGATIRKSMHRLMGTVLGVIIAVPLSMYVFGVYAWSHWLIIIALFVTLLTAVRFYYLAIFFATLLIAAVYYVVTPSYAGPLGFIVLRLLDTFIGIVLAIALEFLVFPNSSVMQVRKMHRQFWSKLYLYFNAVHTNDLSDLNAIHDQVHDSLKQMHLLMDDMRYEPVGKFTLKFRKAESLFANYDKLAEKFNLANMRNEMLYIDNDDMQAVLQNILDLSKLPYEHHKGLVAIIIAIKNKQQLVCDHIVSYASTCPKFTAANQCLLNTVIKLEDITSTPQWRFK